MIKLDPAGVAPILSYNVPEPTSYAGRHVVELQLPAEFFTPAASVVPVTPPLPPPGTIAPVIIRPLPATNVLAATAVQPLVTAVPTTLAAAAVTAAGAQPTVATRTIVAGESADVRSKTDDAVDVATKVAAGFRLARYRDIGGKPAVRTLPPVPPTPRPRLLLVEIYSLSSFLGAYGAGRVLKTFSLLPGEKTKISVKTYARRTEDAKAASSILDSFTQESADDFEKSMSAEQSDKRSESENFEYHAEAEASASWGWGSAKVNGGVKGGTASQREEFAKNVSNAAQKHTSKASAKRDVQINTSTEVKEETGEETAIERVIENVNLSRTLNFVFRQMNQQFVTILQLSDVRVAFFNGLSSSAKEVPIPQLDELLEQFIQPEKIAEVRETILSQVRTVRDYTGAEHPFIETVNLANGDTYLRVRKDLQFSYTEPITLQKIAFTGVPLAVDKFTMRTEGVIVESMLGQASSLDAYAEQLQQLEVRKRAAEVVKLEAEAARATMINTIAETGDLDKAKALAKMICPCDPAPAVAATTPSPSTPPAG
jgi:hypothetical protein